MSESTADPSSPAVHSPIGTDAVPGSESTSYAPSEVPPVVLERRELPKEEGPVWLHAVAADEQRVVAVGGVAEESITDAAVWVSSDGASWRRIDHDESIFGDDPAAGSLETYQYMTDVITGPFGILAVGVDGRPPEYDGAAWVSTEGIEWQRTQRADATLSGPGAQIIRSVMSSGDRFVAVGESSDRVAIWLSDDGIDWIAAVIRAAPGDNPEAPSAGYAITAGGPGLVAVGSHGVEPTPAIWVSADGSTWDRLRSEVDAGGSGVEDAGNVSGRMVATAASGEQLIAVAATADFDWWPSFARPVVWRSVDGLEWIRMEARFAGTPPAAMPAVGAISAWGDHVFAVGGYEGTDPGWSPGLAALWITADDGNEWTVAATDEAGMWDLGPLAVPPGAVDLARFGSTLVVVGNDSRPTGEEINGYPQYVDSAAIWIATIVGR